MTQVISQVELPGDNAIDREKVCPLLLRIFVSTGRHNPLSDYSRGAVPNNELQIYTWMDCTLRELMGLIKDVNPDTRKRGTEFNFSIVSPDRHSARYLMKEIGTTAVGLRCPDDTKTLKQCNFEVGDYIDVSVSTPGQGRFGGGGGANAGGGGGFVNNSFNNSNGGRRPGGGNLPQRFRD